jgi:hypothetical protein
MNRAEPESGLAGFHRLKTENVNISDDFNVEYGTLAAPVALKLLARFIGLDLV